jgi:hypothetical protein
MNTSQIQPDDDYKYSSLSTDDCKQIMMSSIGSIRPSRNSIVGFLNNPHALFESENLQDIFDDESLENGESQLRPSIQSSYHFPTSTSHTMKPIMTILLENGRKPCLSKGFQNDVNEIAPEYHIASSSLYLSSRSDVSLIPDAYAESIDEDIFSDFSEKITPRSSIKTSQGSLLHQACLLYSQTLSVVKSALLLEKANLRKRVPTPEYFEIKHTYPQRKRIKRDSSLTLPLHIAIEYQGSSEVIKCLAQVAPDVIALKDGPNDCNAISAVLYQRRFDSDLLALLIRMNSYALQVVDRYQNTSLHVACAHGAPLEIIQSLCKGYPDALLQINIAGLNPLQVGQQNNLCPIAVIDFLQDLTMSPLEQQSCHLVDC